MTMLGKRITFFGVGVGIIGIVYWIYIAIQERLDPHLERLLFLSLTILIWSVSKVYESLMSELLREGLSIGGRGMRRLR